MRKILIVVFALCILLCGCSQASLKISSQKISLPDKTESDVPESTLTEPEEPTEENEEEAKEPEQQSAEIKYNQQTEKTEASSKGVVPYVGADGAYYIDLEGVTVLLVNKEYALPSDFGGENEKANAALNNMYGHAYDDGIILWTASGYRSYSYQYDLYNSYIAKYGQEYTDTISAKAGHSEHQSGLAFDINSLSDSFANTKEYAWLVENCADYGFILRYTPNGKESTGYMYEPWHYRYIGDATLARHIMDSGLSLEQYAGLA